MIKSTDILTMNDAALKLAALSPPRIHLSGIEHPMDETVKWIVRESELAPGRLIQVEVDDDGVAYLTPASNDVRWAIRHTDTHPHKPGVIEVVRYEWLIDAMGKLVKWTDDSFAVLLTRYKTHWIENDETLVFHPEHLQS